MAPRHKTASTRGSSERQHQNMRHDGMAWRKAAAWQHFRSIKRVAKTS